MDNLIIWFQNVLGLQPEFTIKIIKTLFIFIFFAVLHKIILKVFSKSYEDKPKLLYRARKITSYVLYPLLILIAGRIWFSGFHDISTYLGLVSAGIAIALKDPLVNMAGWFFIVWRRPFEVGDRIQIGDHAGDVIDVRIFQFTLMEIKNWIKAEQSTGRVIHIPNGKVFTQTQANYSKGFKYIWNEVPVLLTFESDWEKAKEVLFEIVKKHSAHLSERAEKRLREVSSRYMIFYSNLTPTVYTSVQDSGVLLTLRYLCKPRNRRDTEQAIWEDILKDFANNPNIDFAYPTTRFYKLNETD
ncbi:MAG: mechanosensitive ion channel family protein [bacterium]